MLGYESVYGFFEIALSLESLCPAVIPVELFSCVLYVRLLLLVLAFLVRTPTRCVTNGRFLHTFTTDILHNERHLPRR